jgi:hypothetical protein
MSHVWSVYTGWLKDLTTGASGYLPRGLDGPLVRDAADAHTWEWPQGAETGLAHHRPRYIPDDHDWIEETRRIYGEKPLPGASKYADRVPIDRKPRPEICDCEFTPYSPSDYEPGQEIEESWHYLRECQECSDQWWGLHCPHDGWQNCCPRCGARPVTIEDQWQPGDPERAH